MPKAKKTSKSCACPKEAKEAKKTKSKSCHNEPDEPKDTIFTPFMCLVCCKRFEHFKTFTEHKMKHVKKLIQCPSCPLKFTEDFLFQQHRLTHDQKEEHKCATCEKTFKVQRHFEKHVKECKENKENVSKKGQEDDVVASGSGNYRRKEGSRKKPVMSSDQKKAFPRLVA